MAFNRPTITDLIERQISDVESRLPGSDPRLRRTLLNALARAQSGSVHGLYGNLDWLAKQIIPDTAESGYLERHANWWGILRKAATSAVGNINLTGTDNSVIPAGAVWQRSDGIEFSVDTEVTITGGTASAAVTASVTGKDGNTAAGSTLSIVSPIAGVDSNATVDASGLSGGTDQETDDQLRDRLRERVQRTPTGGSKDDYILWALSVAGVTRAWCYEQELGIGTVTIRFMMDDTYSDGIPQAADVTAVQDYVDSVRPAGMKSFNAVAPAAVALDMTIQLSPNTSAVQAAVQTELDDLIRREAEPGGTILLSHIREAVSRATGEDDHVVVTPAADVTHTAGQIAVLGTITWQAL